MKLLLLMSKKYDMPFKNGILSHYCSKGAPKKAHFLFLFNTEIASYMTKNKTHTFHYLTTIGL